MSSRIFPQVDNLVFVSGDALGKSVLDKIDLLDWSLVKMVGFQGVEGFIG